ncbi:MAG: hypothetical protein ABSF52_13495 [Syntrophobacteraceae bacterium]
MTLYIRVQMLVVRMSGLKSRIVWMRLRIVPVKSFHTAPHLIAVRLYSTRQPIEYKPLTDNQTDALIEV